MAPKLYGLDANHRTNSVRILAEFEGINLDYTPVDRDAKPKEFTEKFPTELLPALVEENGHQVFETLAVAFYLASKSNKANLFGTSNEEKAEVLQWASWINSNLITAFASWFRPIIFGPFNKKASDDGKAQSAKLLAIVDKYLADKTWLVGERITYADIFLGSAMQRGAEIVVDTAFFAQYPNVRRHFNTIQRQPQAVKVWGKEPTIIEKAKEYVPVEKKKADKPAATPAPAAAAAAPKKKAAEPKDEEDDEPAAAAEPKAKHPCEALGKPTFVLDDWKRKYSNEDTPVAMKWFWENYKPEEYSLWKASYKYNDELTLVFMSSNLIGGFHTRLEGSRKYLFGNACVYGEKGNSRIQGVYLVRGQDWKPVFEVGPDYESFEFTKLDASKEEDRKAVDANWSWEDKVDGLAAADGKVFK